MILIRNSSVLLFTLLLSVAKLSPATESPWQAIVVGKQSGPELLATRDLSRYLAQVTTTAPQVLTAEEWRREPRPAVVLGQVKNHQLLGELNLDVSQVGGEGFLLQNSSLGNQPLLVAVGTTTAGATNAVYGLLRNIGYGFYLGSEAIPQELPATLPTSPVVQNPALGMRGVLPWYNFLNSPTVWDPVDHRAFVDQLVRMGANFVGFHSYGDEPFTAFERDGEMVEGKRLADTGKPVWSTRPLPTSAFAAGTSQLFPYETFGADTTREPDDDTAIRREQDVLRDALAYARARGLHACMGVEVTGNPTQPADRELFLRQFNHVLDQYPTIDYIWIWQQEMRGSHGTHLPQDTTPGAASGATTEPLGLYGEARAAVFDRVVQRARANPRYFRDTASAKAHRAAEGARLEQYAQLALRTLNQRLQAPKLLISGWGGEDRLLSAEYYDGLDKLLPRDVVFASLEYMIPRERIDSIYAQLPPDRQRWPIPWLEYDGDQWHPQPYVRTFEGTLRNITESGSQGFLGIHWRTREVEQNFAYLMEATWQPGLTAEAFFKDYACRCYGPELATEMADIESRLDRLGYRWVGGRGQAEYNVFTWGPGDDPRKVAELQEIGERIETLLKQAQRQQTAARLEWMLHRIRYVLSYQETGEAVVKARRLLDQAAGETTATASELARRAQETLLAHPLDRALNHYAQRITTRGEHGVLATINTKAWPSWLDLYKRSCQLAGEKWTTPTQAWVPGPQILLPRHYGSLPEGEMLELMPIVLGGKTAFIHYRRLGEQRYHTDQLHLLQRWVFYTTIPAAMVAAPGVQFGFSFDADPAAPMAFGPIAVTAMQTAKASRPIALKPLPSRSSIVCKLETVKGRRQLTWPDMPGAEYFSIKRDGQHYLDTALPFAPLRPGAPAGRYTVTAMARGQVLGTSAAFQVR